MGEVNPGTGIVVAYLVCVINIIHVLHIHECERSPSPGNSTGPYIAYLYLVI